jgi:hypothetical protein
MKIKVIVALFLLIVILGWQVSCSACQVKVEKIIVERRVDAVSDKNLIH